MKPSFRILSLLLALGLTSIPLSAAPFSNDWFYNPFNQHSAHHRPIGTGAIYAADDDPAMVDWQREVNGINLNTGAPWGVSVASTDATDPLMTIAPGPERCDPVVGFPLIIRFPKEGFRTKVVYNARGCTDGVVVIYDHPTGIPHQIRQYNWNEGKPQGGQYKTWDIKGPAHGDKLDDRVGTSASGVAALFGILRGWEVAATGHPIGHALQMCLQRRNGAPRLILGREVWWPAVSMDGGAYVDPKVNTGHIPYGSLWAIPPVDKGGPDLTKLGLTEKGLRFAEALRDYGAYVVDGGDGPVFRCDQDVAPYKNELVQAAGRIFRHMRLVVNSVPENGKIRFAPDRSMKPVGPNRELVPGGFPAGGGTPLAPNTAIDAASGKTNIPNPSAGI